MGKSNLKVSQENADRGWKEGDLFKLCVEKFKGLICLKSSKVDVNNFIIKDTSNPVPYQVYRRNTLKDKVVLVPIQDLIDNVPFLELERDESLLKNG
jgi:hypothetical protein